VRTRALAAVVLITTLFLLTPRPAEAQRHVHGGFSISVGFGFGPPVYWLYDPWVFGYPYRPFGHPWYWGPYYPPYPPFPYPYYPYHPYGYPFEPFSVSVRLDAEPVQAEVYVNGHRAGNVDDYDGVFQRLVLRPGEHEIVLYLDGHQTVHERRYFNPGASQTIRLTMVPLAPGDVAEPRPVPPPPSPRDTREPSRSQGPPPQPIEQPAPFGTLSIRVQPADAEIVIDGECWTGNAAGMPMVIELAAGRRRIEVRKEGYEPYAQDVLIRTDRTLTLNVSLTRRSTPQGSQNR
jgi:hypothetical protein